MATCVSCGDELHPERAERYDYCTKPECQERNARGLPIVAVGVNKAADQYVVLNDRTRRDMAGGRYKKVPESPAAPGRNNRRPRFDRKPSSPPRSSPSRPRRQWSEAQQRLALNYRAMGLKPPEIAKKLGISQYLVTQILLLATGREGR